MSLAPVHKTATHGRDLRLTDTLAAEVGRAARFFDNSGLW
jgi:hypothetical protein